MENFNRAFGIFSLGATVAAWLAIFTALQVAGADGNPEGRLIVALIISAISIILAVMQIRKEKSTFSYVCLGASLLFPLLLLLIKIAVILYII